MDFLKAEIERKKRQMQEKGVMAGPEKKYFKRGDLAQKQREEYHAKHAPKSDDIKQLQDAKLGNKDKCKLKRHLGPSQNTPKPLFSMAVFLIIIAH